MAPVTNKANLKVDPKNTINNDESDEGSLSPSLQLIGMKNRKESSIHQSTQSESENSSSSENDSHTDTSSSSSSSGPASEALQVSGEESCKPSSAPKATVNGIISRPGISGSTTTLGAATTKGLVPNAVVEAKGEGLAKFIVYTLLGKVNGVSNDRVERTLLRCVRLMMQRHEILFRGMMKRLQVTKETGYVSFVTVANTLFEDEKMVITWSRIVALYAFGGQLALYCKENKMEDFAYIVPVFMGKYVKEVLTPYVTSIGGWSKICEEFPEECDIENKVRRVLSWTALGLGVAATVSYLTSR